MPSPPASPAAGAGPEPPPPPPAPVAPSPAPAARDTVLLRVRGLPFSTSDEELVAFFEGHDLDDACPVYVCRRSGERERGLGNFGHARAAAPRFAPLAHASVPPPRTTPQT